MIDLRSVTVPTAGTTRSSEIGFSGLRLTRVLAGLAATLLLASGASVFAAPATGVSPLPAGVRPAYVDQRERVHLDEVVLRFVPDAGARVREGRLESLFGLDLSPIEVAVAMFGGSLERRFRQQEEELDYLRARAEARARRSLPDLNSFATIRLPEEPNASLAVDRADALLVELERSGLVAEAWLTPWIESADRVPTSTAGTLDGPVDAPIDPDDERSFAVTARSGIAARSNAAERVTAAGRSAAAGGTPDFSPLQGYLYESPVGVNAPVAWSYPGGDGTGVDMIDIEWGWLFTHEDLKAPFHLAGAAGQDDHGTAVLGEIAGQHNGYGVDGISPEARIGAISLNTYSVAGAIVEAATVLDPGDVFLMEVQCSGPQGWLPCEWYSDVYAAIDVATAAGVICVEAGGNGTVNLDDPRYSGLFDKHVRDSGAIMVGAGTPQGLTAEWFTNYGSRVDLQGWGSSIVTTCCGDLQGGIPEVRYTGGFNGTSGASPIVVGSICSLQGQALALFGEPLSPDLAEELLGATGSPWSGDRQIGERPNLAAARDRLVAGYGDLHVLVRDGDTHEPLDGRFLTITETGRLDRTGPDGTVTMQLSAVPLTIHVIEDFYYSATDVPYTVAAGGEEWLTIDLYRTPTGSLAGTVRRETGVPVEGAAVALPWTPLSAAQSGSGGGYILEQIPQNTGYDALAYGVPGLGVSHANVDVASGEITDWNPVLVDANTFEASGGGYSPTNEWEWGAPGSPPGAFSGAKVWDTNLGGFYGNNQTSILTSPIFDVSDVPHIYLSFHHWYWIESGDGGQLQVWESPPGRWIAVQPIGGYPDDSIQVLGDSGGYSGYTIDGYVPAFFDLSEWAGDELRFRFYFRSDASGRKLGWCIDDVALDLGQSTTSVDDFEMGAAPRLSLVSAGPNPSAGSSTVRFALRAPAAVELSIFDAAGNEVRRVRQAMIQGTHDLTWDGRSDRGLVTPAGVFYFRLAAGSDRVSGRWVRIR